MYSPDESGLHAALGAFFRYGRGCVVSSRKVNFRYVPVAIGAAVAARKFNGFHRSLGLSCFHASSPFRKHVLHIVAHFLPAFNGPGPVHDLLLFWFAKSCKAVQGIECMASSMVKPMGSSSLFILFIMFITSWLVWNRDSKNMHGAFLLKECSQSAAAVRLYERQLKGQKPRPQTVTAL